MNKNIVIALLLLAFGSRVHASERSIEFSGMTWMVKSGDGRGPGPNNWSDKNVWLDGEGNLHLMVAYNPVTDKWECAEVYTREPITMGAYHFFLNGRPQEMDKNVVLGLVLYETDEQEVDIEFSQWSGDAPRGSAQYVVQPAESQNHMKRFSFEVSGQLTTNSVDWKASQIEFRSLEGHSTVETEGTVISRWATPAPTSPALRSPRLHINLWLFRGKAPSDGKDVELVINRVEKTPDLGPQPPAGVVQRSLERLPRLPSFSAETAFNGS